MGEWHGLLVALAVGAGALAAIVLFMVASAALGSLINRLFGTGSKLGELIATVLIIAVLAAVAIPAWQDYREKQRRKADQRPGACADCSRFTSLEARKQITKNAAATKT